MRSPSIVGFSATSGQAAPGAPAPSAPTTSAQAMAQLKAFNEQFEKVTEQYNDARILLVKRTAAVEGRRGEGDGRRHSRSRRSGAGSSSW